MKRVVVIGGGKGQAALLRGLKRISDIHLTSLVTVADDGGSTGRLRSIFDIPAMGDIRNVMVAMAPEETILSHIMSYRFKENAKDLSGHSLGNLILSALTESSGDFLLSISNISKVLNIKGDIIPSTTQTVTLKAVCEDGATIIGENRIGKEATSRIQSLSYVSEVHASPQAIEAISKADFIFFGVGSLYTSILPNLIIPELGEALINSKARKIFVANAMTQKGETKGYDLNDHLQAIFDHCPINLDLAIVANTPLPDYILDHYALDGCEPLTIRFPSLTKVLSYDLLTTSGNTVVHDELKVQRCLEEVMSFAILHFGD
jgi:uncharacterized cofD-like protein